MASPVVPASSPFAKIRVRWLIGLFLLSAAVVLLVLGLAARRSHHAMDPRLIALLLTLVMVLPVFILARSAGLSWRRLIGARPTEQDLPLLAAIVPTAILTMASAFLIYGPLSYVLPGFVRRQLLADNTLFDVSTVWEWVLLALAGAVLAPVLEEVVFRGFIMQRWGYRWGTRTGVMASSALFAVLHGEWVGHFLFGVVMSLLYLRTRRLLVPVLAHGIHNFVLMLPLLYEVLAHLKKDPPETLATLRAHIWTGVPLLAVGLMLGWGYLRAFWPGDSVRATLAGDLPYDTGDAGLTNLATESVRPAE